MSDHRDPSIRRLMDLTGYYAYSMGGKAWAKVFDGIDGHVTRHVATMVQLRIQQPPGNATAQVRVHVMNQLMEDLGK